MYPNSLLLAEAMYPNRYYLRKLRILTAIIGGSYVS